MANPDMRQQNQGLDEKQTPCKSENNVLANTRFCRQFQGQVGGNQVLHCYSDRLENGNFVSTFPCRRFPADEFTKLGMDMIGGENSPADRFDQVARFCHTCLPLVDHDLCAQQRLRRYFSHISPI